ncbi:MULTISPECIES: helix-turn-helix domain-containing protein [unclassified Crossiella]|uniref:helix-turn-helix domain-containing protein n=1 Tax=unclassified Crossiella TaxID=2620835 RepID=UPI001FFF0B29|nr:MULTISPECIES: helix-turn-helix domain-containing protein [unclassified Crossiella]MCK2243660.1 helix-turn-helix domain-containing protein [Crossiella sp. S99.2]MCK2257519.1 helix-turn-helix domain-containing protein [Crossiella sp. S99.1]
MADEPLLKTESTEPPALSQIAQHLNSILNQLAQASTKTQKDTPEPLMTPEQVAELVQIPVRTLKNQLAAGAIPHRRFGKHYRFSAEDYKEIVRRSRHVGSRGPTIR